MNLAKTHMRFFISGYRKTKEQPHSLGIEGFLSMLEISLPIFREKKTGTSVIANSSSNYSASHSPPPIRPLVEKHPYFELPVSKDGIQNPIEECA